GVTYFPLPLVQNPRSPLRHFSLVFPWSPNGSKQATSGLNPTNKQKLNRDTQTMSAKKSGTKTASAKEEEEKTFEYREVVLGKMRGFPPWPAMVVDPGTVPKSVAKERPATKKITYYAVRFFPSGDYAWLSPRDITNLPHSQILQFIEAPEQRTKPDLVDGYKKALDPEAWEAAITTATPPPKKGRKGRKKKDDDDEDEDELAEDNSEDSKPGKKRKRASSPVAKKSAAKKGKGKKSKETVESEDDGSTKPPTKKSKGSAAETNAALESDPEAVKVREWRHKLQKTFLSSNKTVPKDDDMPAIDTLFTTVESYGGMNIDYLTFSKIGKVMRHIHLLEDERAPRDADFKFRERAKALVDKWQQILNAHKAGPDTDGAAANGTEEEKVHTEETNGVAAEQEDKNEAVDGDLTMMDVTMDGE
ncbi:unnamed protein product, partial [Mycena citricolor]